MNILQAIRDPNLFLPFFGSKLKTWRSWRTALRAVYGLPLHDSCRPILRECTGRTKVPATGFNTALFLTGRRSGKSRTAAVIAAFEAVLAGHESKLAVGERGIVAICAPTKLQGRIVRDYIRSLFEVPMLANELARETREGFELNSGTRIEILAGDFRTIRGYTLLAAIIDEIAFFGIDEESKIKSDTELVRAIKPSLATVGGRLICISSPYAKKGWCYKTWKNNFGNDAGRVLVWNCSSRTMNPSLPQSVVDDAMAEDPCAARSEYMGEFRDDVAEFLSRAVIESFVVKGRLQLLPREGTKYYAFVDVSGGRRDDAALAIAHRDGNRKVIVDLAKRWKPPFSPHEIVGRISEELRPYGCRYVTGDNYAAEFVSRSFKSYGIGYLQCEKNKSVLYGELLPLLCSGEVELLDNELLIDQLAGLERRTRAGGKDIIDHPPGGHDDLSNAVAGAAVITSKPKKRVGPLFRERIEIL